MKKLLIAAAAFGIASGVSAASYQAQGCGLGSTLFTDGSSLVDQVLGSTTNGSSANQTFGMTSGTSNCELDGSGGQAKIVFIEANKASLANDIARGNGETLASLGEIYGCDSQKMGTSLQKNYSKIFSTDAVTAQEISTSISSVLSEDKACI